MSGSDIDQQTVSLERTSEFGQRDSGRKRLQMATNMDKNVKWPVFSEAFENFTKLYEGPRVTIHVGSEEEKTFTLPKAMLYHHSDYFKAVFEGGFREGKEQVLDLDEVDPGSFQHIVQWLYTGIIVPEVNMPANTIVKGVQKICDVLVVADRLGSTGIEAYATSTMRKYMLGNPEGLDVKTIRDISKLPSQHPARALIAEACVRTIRDPTKAILASGSMRSSREIRQELLENEMESNPELALDVLKAIKKTVRLRVHGKQFWTDPLAGLDFHITGGYGQ